MSISVQSPSDLVEHKIYLGRAAPLYFAATIPPSTFPIGQAFTTLAQHAWWGGGGQATVVGPTDSQVLLIQAPLEHTLLNRNASDYCTTTTTRKPTSGEGPLKAIRLWLRTS
jgi:hypothetical protein